MYGLSNGGNIFHPQVTSEGQRSRSNPKNCDVLHCWLCCNIIYSLFSEISEIFRNFTEYFSLRCLKILIPIVIN